MDPGIGKGTDFNEVAEENKWDPQVDADTEVLLEGCNS